MHRLWILAVAGVLSFTACKKQTPPPAPPPAADQGMPTQAQEKLPTAKLWLGPGELIAEVANTPRQLMTGMMFRTNMAENEAMLFVFPQPFRASFWMKNTRLPLSAAYVTSDGTVMEIHDLQPYDTNAVVASRDDILFVIETTQGWFKRHNVSPGAVVRCENGALISNFRFQYSQ